MSIQLKLRGKGVDRTAAYSIITKGKRASTERQCPYRRNTVRWSIWVTAFRNKSVSHSRIYQALQDAKAQVDWVPGEFNFEEPNDD